jgi:glycosyltransferase involved in cell wall biosynthesis
MKLALCLEYPIGQHGGTEVLVRELIRGLAPRHQIVLVSPDTRESLARSGVAGLIAEHVGFQPEWKSKAAAEQLARRIAATKPDLAHFHFGGNYAWGNRAFDLCPVVPLRRLGVRCLSTNHGAFSILEGYVWHARALAVKLVLFLPAWLSKLHVLRHLLTEIAVSQNDWRALRRWYFPLRGKFRWIYHSRLAGDPTRVDPSMRKRVILCAGTIGPRKGQPLLIEAFGRIAAGFPDWTLVLAGREGDAEVRGEVRALIAREGIEARVRFLGPQTDEELTTLYRESAIFALPSRYEGLGLTLQEAQFHGCACVACAAGGVNDLVQDGENGLLTPVGDAGALAAALERLMRDEQLRARLGARAPESVLEKGMTAPQMVAAYERLYAELAAGK